MCAKATSRGTGESQSDSFSGLMEDPDLLRAAFRKRRDPFDYQSVHPADEDQAIAQGWAVHKQGKKKVVLKRAKSPSKTLEDRVWCLFYRMRYPVLNDVNLRIQYERPDGTTGKKQIDVLAKDDETVIVVECKSREQRGRRSLQKDLHETTALQRPIANSVRKTFGLGFKPKVLWFYVTTNIIWSEQDAERAAAANIRVITENELQYFDAFIAHMGPAGRFQFLAEFLQGQEIPELSNVRVPATKGRFGAHTFYSFVSTPRTLLKIAFVNHQALNHPDGRPAYQRMINKGRIKSIGRFIQSGGFFPTNLLLNFIEKCRFDLLPRKDDQDDNVKFGWLYLPDKYKSAWVIDGQHRLYGYSHLSEKYLNHSLFVLAFEKMDTKTEAELFITINHEQKSVPKSLLIALQADLKLGSEDPKAAIGALASALVKALAVDRTSPFFQRVQVPGIVPTASQILTIPEIVNGILRSNILGRVIQKKTFVPGHLSADTDQNTISRGRRVLNAYFRAIMEANPSRWEAGRSSYICVNPGIRAHLQLVTEILRYLETKESFEPYTAAEDDIAHRLVRFVEPILQFVSNAPDEQVEAKFSRKFGEGGVREYYYYLCELLVSAHPDFGSTDFHDYLARRSDQRIAGANQDIIDLQEVIAKYVVDTLKKVHGTHELKSGEKAYWERGIDNVNIKLDAYKKQQQSPTDKQLPKEAYLDFINFKDIVRLANNWNHFDLVMGIQMMDEKGGKKYYLDWMDKLNELRRIPRAQNYAKDVWRRRFRFHRLAQEGTLWPLR